MARNSSSYSPKVAAEICNLIAEGASLTSIAAMPGMPPRRTVRTWLAAHPSFEQEYERARRARADALVEEALTIADSVKGCTEAAEVNAARLAVDTRKWLAAKLLPERFGDRVTQEITGADGKDLLPPDATAPDRLALAILAVLQPAPKPPGLLRLIDPPAPAPPRFDVLSGKPMPRRHGDDA
jgi:hypothetical protein